MIELIEQLFHDAMPEAIGGLIAALVVAIVGGVYALFKRRRIAINPMGPFVIKMTKSQFETELGRFLNRPNFAVLDNWWVLRRLRVQDERKKLPPQINADYRNWEIVTSIMEADNIKLTRAPYRGLVLELTDKEIGLWVVVHAEGDWESDTVYEDGAWRHKGDKYIPVNAAAQDELIDWLTSMM